MKRILTFTALLAWCGVLLALRAWCAQNLMHSFLVWNLFLAAIPFAAALLFERGRRVRHAAGDARGVAAVPAERAVVALLLGYAALHVVAEE